jgi:hypothetical protein
MRVKIKSNIFSFESYPWLPNLIGKTGTVVKIRDFLTDPDNLESTVYTVKMDEPFFVDIPDESISACGYQPKKERLTEKYEWTFLNEEIEILER